MLFMMPLFKVERMNVYSTDVIRIEITMLDVACKYSRYCTRLPLRLFIVGTRSVISKCLVALLRFLPIAVSWVSYISYNTIREETTQRSYLSAKDRIRGALDRV